MEWESTALSAFISVVTGLLVSFGFFRFLLAFYQPRIEIAEEAIRTKTIDGNEIIKVKIRNLRNRPVSGIRAEMHRRRYVARGNGRLTRTHLLPLIRSDPLGLAECNDPNMHDLYIFRTLEKTRNDKSVVAAMDEYPGCELLFRILVIDGHSGLGKLFRKSYRWPADVRNGEYAAGREITAAARRNS
jgi:hypothetical protein